MPLQHRSEDQLAISRKRKEKNVGRSANVDAANQNNGKILPRRWLQANLDETTNLHQLEALKVMTWNMLAQTLVRRELFPASDCLKASQREGMLFNEIIRSNADVICLQEVDRLERLTPILESSGYSYAFAAGPQKKHGCLIAFRTAQFEKVSDHTVLYDDAFVHPEGNSTYRKGSSFRTKNVGLMIALRRIDGKSERVVIATTHLFWHPRYSYERARQAGILLREVVAFRDQMGCAPWPCIIAGDFNFTPSDAAYSLLVGDDLLPEQETEICASRVVHVTIDPTIEIINGRSTEGDEGDPDRVITNARQANAEDGLLDIEEMVQFYQTGITLTSVYDHWASAEPNVTYGMRVPVHPSRRGRFEPIYTSYTHYWKTVLDYIFVISPAGYTCEVIGILEPPLEGDLTPGIPRKGVCGSDHISLVTRIGWSASKM
ncbi:Endonuclease/exonuclease/phosphatase [Rickenella mellea]|uniref:Endonuclease/exonuclease/phosphatase n=1 Tax=Rickenella mellea TaxID=50990 RepID=A0A4Y7QLF6_9AGAM|nr:Endonuclease/exonuclease/phosphatase [Rickenella mellea]